MADYVILSDSCMDLSKEQREQFKIETPVAGSIVYPDGSDHLADIDWETISFEEFYRRLDKKEAFKTGIPNQYAITTRVEEYFKQGKDTRVDAAVEWFKESPENNKVFVRHSVGDNTDVYIKAVRDDKGEVIGFYNYLDYRNAETGKEFDLN